MATSRKELLTRLTICSPCILLSEILVISCCGFEGWIWVLIPSVPGLCILFTSIKPEFDIFRFSVGQDVTKTAPVRFSC